MARSAIIQARVNPEIKFASEHVLRNIGLTMTEAFELFLRRLIIEQKLPFEVVAFDDTSFAAIVSAWSEKIEGMKAIEATSRTGRGAKKQKRE